MSKYLEGYMSKEGKQYDHLPYSERYIQEMGGNYIHNPKQLASDSYGGPEGLNKVVEKVNRNRAEADMSPYSLSPVPLSDNKHRGHNRLINSATRQVPDLGAFYHPRTKTAYFPPSFFKRPVHQQAGMLFHESIHHVDEVSGRASDEIGKRYGLGGDNHKSLTPVTESGAELVPAHVAARRAFHILHGRDGTADEVYDMASRGLTTEETKRLQNHPSGNYYTGDIERYHQAIAADEGRGRSVKPSFVYEKMYGREGSHRDIQNLINRVETKQLTPEEHAKFRQIMDSVGMEERNELRSMMQDVHKYFANTSPYQQGYNVT